MKKLFYPAIVLMNKLGFSKKLMLLGLINFIALSIVISAIYLHDIKQINMTKKELKGIALVQPILKTIQGLQRHRGLSAGVLGGSTEFLTALELEAKDLASHFKSLDMHLSPALLKTQQWLDIQAAYQQIRQEGLNWRKEESFLKHIELIAALQQAMIDIADSYQLTLDPNIETNYLILTTIQDMPMALEQLGQIRAYGTGALAKQSFSEQEHIKLHALMLILVGKFDLLAVNLEKTSRYNQQIRTKLLLAAENIKSSSDKITHLVKVDILAKKFQTEPQVFFELATRVINEGYAEIYETLLPTTAILFYARIHEIEEKLLINVGTAALLMLLAEYLFFGIYYAIMGNIKLISRSAYRYTQGDLEQRISLHTDDETQKIGDSFNQMADSANELLAIQLESQERLQSIIDSALDAIIQINAQGNVTGWNEQATVIFGWTAAEAKGKLIHKLIIPEHYQASHINGLKKYLKMEQGGLLKSRFEIEALNKAGELFPVELAISTVKLAKGGFEFSAFIRDLRKIKQAEKSLRQLSLAVEQSPSSIMITDINANIEYANQAFLEVTGYDFEEIIGRNPKLLSSNRTPKETYQALWQQLKMGKIWQGELINKRKDGTEYIESALISPIRQENGEITHYLAIKEDITEKKQAEIELSLAAIAFESQEGIMITDNENHILRVNKSFTRITGYTPEEIQGKSPTILNSGKQDSAFYDVMWKKIRQEGAWQGEIWNRNKQGNVYPEWLTITARKDDEDNITHYVAIFTDITEFKAAEERIKQLAYYDPLTNLANRRKLLDRLEHCITMSKRAKTQFAVLMLDLDRFKAVNDHFGHLAGDDLLQQVAKRITQRLRSSDLLARLGGDEFVVLLDDIKQSNDAARVATEIIAALAEPFLLNAATHEAYIGTSIGISLYPEHAQSVSKLMDYADMALYKAKDNGRGCYAFFSNQLTENVQARLKLEHELALAIKQQDLRVYYQPQVDVVTGKIIGAEALVRWQTKDKGLISPTIFIPIAEQTGLIIELGRWVLHETCRQGQQWLQDGLQPITLAVNVSAEQFKRCDMYEEVQQALAITGFPAEYLELEMTESGLMEDQESLVSLLNKLRSLGILLAIDDFGTGYSSLAYLKRFPLDTLKIDKSFIEDIPHNQDDLEIATTINAMGHTLGFKVLAEGVETQQQLDFLQRINCDVYQGYIKSKPLPAAEFSALLTSIKNS